MADPTALYSYKGGEPAYITEIVLSSGLKRTNLETFTEEELSDAGYTGPYTIPDFDQEYQRISWDSKNLTYVVNDISDGELWQRIRDKRDLLLKNSDWTMMVDSPVYLNYREWQKYRQALRDLPHNFGDPKSIVWPESPEGKSDDEFNEPRVYENSPIETIRSLNSNLNQVISVVGIASTSLIIE